MLSLPKTSKRNEYKTCQILLAWNLGRRIKRKRNSQSERVGGDLNDVDRYVIVGFLKALGRIVR
jgi:hypothetical protein